ncbi:unnamed protein product, partial [Aphanomyces euteiches]
VNVVVAIAPSGREGNCRRGHFRICGPTHTRSKQVMEEGTGTWNEAEHQRFLTGISMYPHGPWKKVAEIVQTRSVRQTQTHAQKYREKLARHERGLRIKPSGHDDDKLQPLPYTPSDDDPFSMHDAECIQFLLEALSIPDSEIPTNKL